VQRKRPGSAAAQAAEQASEKAGKQTKKVPEPE